MIVSGGGNGGKYWLQRGMRKLSVQIFILGILLTGCITQIPAFVTTHLKFVQVAVCKIYN